MLQQLPKQAMFPRGWSGPEGCGSLMTRGPFPLGMRDAGVVVWHHTKQT